ncbi:hypothetical protein J5Y09_15590 [Roseomonas sp. PWR1]|uniref:AraC family transcriptional regulator n=1 Tax=Roseomonas nitratireducens TaxID=2820810 RepID=A0ABS4AVF5_9PROT|nr:hypothetical protein [Neoroseomonas nitratireducens]MBP0465348.1 hypothetical protein [Neoroseomonas nitratireducens]
MRGVIRLSAADWLGTDDGVRASLPVPRAARCAVLAEGWAEPGAASLVAGAGAPVAFLPLGAAAFAWCAADGGDAITLHAPAPPARCRVAFHPSGIAATFAAALPRALATTTARSAQGSAPHAESLAEALGRAEPDAALAILADMLIAAREAPETIAAARALLRHAARHPLWRGPALGALPAALMEEEARSAWP